MIVPEPGQELPVHEVFANNHGRDHPNRIHSDDGAAKYGFEGALVPGVGLYAYMTRPVVDALGREWLERGAMRARFIHPVYDGERVQVSSRVASADPLEISLELHNDSNTICAIGAANLMTLSPKIDPVDYPVRQLPSPDQLRPASIDGFTAGDILGSLEFTLDLGGEVARFLDDIVERSPIYFGEDAVCHPAFWIARANEIVMQNLALGPWIHTSSEAEHFATARDGERLSLRGRVVETFNRRGNEYLVLDLGMFGEGRRPIVRIRHTAIIKLRLSEG
jgi:hypothetical protein